jgi:phosphate transport system substrate-binding protein
MTSTRRRTLLRAAIPLSVGMLAAGLPRARAQSAKLIRGAGATFPAPLYQAWIQAFEAARPEIDLEYDVVGSGEGVSRFVTGSVDFAASDAAMTDEQIAMVEGGVRMIPATAGLVAVIYNVPGLSTPLRLPRDLLAAIFTGEVAEWDDLRIAAANPGVALPARTIAIVARLDSSGTTFAFTNHLSALSETWRKSHGAATRVDWPGGAMLMRGNEGVAGRVLQSEYSIGYAEFGFAQRLNLQMAELQNVSGSFVAPSIASGEAALAGSADDLPENLRLFIADPAGPGSYPIATFSWLLLYASAGDAATRAAVADFVRYGLTDGQALAAELGYIPLPAAVVERSLTAVTGLI